MKINKKRTTVLKRKNKMSKWAKNMTGVSIETESQRANKHFEVMLKIISNQNNE